MAADKRPLKVFLCHAHVDRDPVRGLPEGTRLTKDGVDRYPWLDKEKLSHFRSLMKTEVCLFLFKCTSVFSTPLLIGLRFMFPYIFNSVSHVFIFTFP